MTEPKVVLPVSEWRSRIEQTREIELNRVEAFEETYESKKALGRRELASLCTDLESVWQKKRFKNWLNRPEIKYVADDVVNSGNLYHDTVTVGEWAHAWVIKLIEEKYPNLWMVNADGFVYICVPNVDDSGCELDEARTELQQLDQFIAEFEVRVTGQGLGDSDLFEYRQNKIARLRIYHTDAEIVSR